MAITKVINDAVDLNQTSDYSGLRLPVGTTGDVVESFTTEYLVVAGGGGTSGDSPGGGGGGGLRTSYDSSTTTTNSLSFPSGKTAVATYMLNNNATDVSGNYNGTENNITYAQGKYGGGAIFNGSSSYISTSSNPNASGGARTFSAWIKTTSTSFQSIITNGGVSYSSGLNMFVFNNKLYITSGNGTSNENYGPTSSANVNTGSWVHCAVTMSATAIGSTLKTYVNGNLDGTHTTTVAITDTINAFAIGGRNLSGSISTYFNGSIDQVRIYNSELSAQDITNIYNNEVQANSGGGVAAETSLTLTAGVAYDVTVGAGGASSTIGSSSIFSTITSTGGGRGGGSSGGYSGGNGGSGGGGAGGIYSSAGGNGTIAQGYAGGSSGANTGGTSYPGGGGGGAVSVGASPSGSGDPGGNGGAGLAVNILNATNAASASVGEVSSSNVYYSGGGGGSTYQGTPGTGGLGGAGDGDRSDDGTSANNGTINTGGGGGGTNATGGSGVVILRYPTASVSSFTVTGTLNTPSTTDTLASAAYPTTNTAYYKLDGNATDSSGNGYNGTASNVAWSNGRFGQAAVFNGSSSYINLGSISGLPTNTNNTVDFSFSGWVKATTAELNAASGSNFFFGNRNNSYQFIGMGGNTNSNFPTGEITYYTYGGPGYHNSWIQSPNTYDDGQWHHVVVTDKYNSSTDNRTRTLYVDTVQVAQDTVDKQFSTGTGIVSLGTTDVNTFGRNIDQVRIFTSALTASQITELYEEHYQTQFTEGSDTAIIFTEGTGTVTFSGVDPAPPQGVLRANTSYSEDGSASVIEHYNGTDWKYFDAIKYCTTNTLNFPSGAGCIASYNLDNNVNDIGNTYNGVNSNVTFNASGKFGAAAVFNGSSSYVSLPSNFNLANNSFTISAWFANTKTSANSYGITSSGSGTSCHTNLHIGRRHNNGKFTFAFFCSDLDSSTNMSTDGTWQHWVCTYDTTTNSRKIYLNGTLDASDTASNDYIGTANLQLGGGTYWGTGNEYQGKLDQVRIFNDSLTSDEVSKLYNNEIACS